MTREEIIADLASVREEMRLDTPVAEPPAPVRSSFLPPHFSKEELERSAKSPSVLLNLVPQVPVRRKSRPK
jgi:hypothetical protein